MPHEASSMGQSVIRLPPGDGKQNYQFYLDESKEIGDEPCTYQLFLRTWHRDCDYIKPSEELHGFSKCDICVGFKEKANRVGTSELLRLGYRKALVEHYKDVHILFYSYILQSLCYFTLFVYFTLTYNTISYITPAIDPTQH